MARKLKTYITNLGFFELAIAAPSMKAALDAWGMSHNAFQHGFAKQTEDRAIVAATQAKPGVVLRRAVGTSGAFSEDAALPDSLPNIRPPVKTVSKPVPKNRGRKKPQPKDNPAAILSFEAARRKREQERARQEARLAKEEAARKRATGAAETALEEARRAHREIMAGIEREREKIERKDEKESARWQAQLKKLEQAVERARR